MAKAAREFEVIVWGASGFTGRLVAEYLLQRYGPEGTLTWAMAGRNLTKLEAVRAEIAAKAGVDPETIPLVVADSHDEASLAAMVNRASVICTTVGPYARYGTELVAACAASGTHYCDLCGEPQWIRAMIDQYEDQARESGARIVHCCGFDSIPSDMGVYFTQQQMQARHGVACQEVRFLLEKAAGAASGGTIASMMNLLEQASKDADLRRLLVNPYTLNPIGEQTGPDKRDQTGAVFQKEVEAWTGPFVMAAINTRVVRRTNALLGYPYGKSFVYSEAILTGPGPAGWLKAGGIGAAMGGMVLGSAFGPTRSVIKKFLPDPGEGPSEDQREAGFYRILFLGKHPDDASSSIKVRVVGDRDPGYGSTCKMLGESAVCLARDELTCGGGMLTPASAMGESLLTRLQANAGLTFEVLD